MVELLAPAGDKEKMEYAFLYGADAVYFGGQNFSLRANAKNFSLEEIKEATIYAHSLNKKVYVTVNIVFHNDDLEGLEEYLTYLGQIGVDGIIASDIVVMDMLKKLNIKTKLIISTQASVLNEYSALFYKTLGAGQIVLAREALEEDIKAIKDKTNLELEAFIHGAMCTSISGKCILSNYTTLRDSNRGGCAQICRWVFNEDDEYPFTMTSKDLNFIDQVRKMIDLGINTFKIEGRMRGIYYIATVTLCYRRVIDKILNNTLTEDDKKYYLKVLNKVANRDSAPQFLEKLPNENDQYYSLRDEESNQDFLGIVLGNEDGLVKVEERNLFKVGDKIEIMGPNHETYLDEILEIYDEDKNKIEVANKPKMIIYIKINHQVEIRDLIRTKLF